MLIKIVSNKVSDMKNRSYLNLKETERDESSDSQINVQQEPCMHFIYNSAYWMDMDAFWRVISFDVIAKQNMLLTVLLL